MFECFHVARVLPWNTHPPMNVGETFHVGGSYNPFFGFYEEARKYPVETPTGTVHSPAMTFLKAVSRGEVNCPSLPDIAVEIANHYLILARELLTEEVRRERFSNLPSRRTCLWAAEDIERAHFWAERLGGACRILRLEVDGVSHSADASFLLGDSQSISETYRRAEWYWEGRMADNPECELLIEGEIRIVEELA